MINPHPSPTGWWYTTNLNSTLGTIVIQVDDVVKKLKGLNTNKSSGPDEINPKLISELAEILSEPLTILLNSSLRSGKIPKEWKTAVISAVFKKGSRNIAGNYRPISLTCVLCRIMESSLKDAIMTHFLENGYFPLVNMDS